MKSAIYSERGIVQVILTPENEFEKGILEMFKRYKPVQTFWGNFSESEGGYFRQYNEEDSLILLLDKREKK